MADSIQFNFCYDDEDGDTVTVDVTTDTSYYFDFSEGITCNPYTAMSNTAQICSAVSAEYIPLSFIYS